jgi:hypothetical protein
LSLQTWFLVLVAGLLAGVIGWAGAESAMTGDTERVREKGRNVPLASDVGQRDATISFGIQGAVLGLLLGATGGCLVRSVRQGIAAALTGLVAGGLAGAGTSRWLVPFYFDNLSTGDLTYSLVVNGGIGGAIGAASGLALGLGRGGASRAARAALAGMGAGLIAMTLFVFAGSILSPRAMADRPVPITVESRFAARLLLSLFVAAGTVLAESSSPRRSSLAKS